MHERLGKEPGDERTAVDLLGRRTVASVLLVQALGGGWNMDDLSAGPAPVAE